MKTRFLLISALLVSALIGCSKESNEMIDEAVNPKEANFSILVKSEDTKTTNSGMSTLWKSGDKINVFHALTGSSTYVNDNQFTASADGANVSFTGTVEGELSGNYDWYAIYPYSSYIASGTPANTDPGYVTIGSAKTGIQTQTGNNSTAHICGNNYPIAGKTTNVPAATTPSITMSHLSSLIKVMVKNGTEDPIAVRQIQFTSDEAPIVGNYYVDFHGTSPSFTAVAEKTNTTAVLKVTDGGTIAKGSSAAFYLAIKPYTEADGNNLKLKVSTYTAEQEKTKAADGDVVFAPGKCKTLNFTFTAVPSVATLPFSIDGDEGKAGYVGKDGLTVDNVTADDYTSNSPYLAKWSNNGAFIQLHYNTAAGKVSFSVRKSGGADNSTFHLTGSVDGITYHDIQDFVVSGAQYVERHFETTNSAIDPSYRYLRLTFEKGSNVGFGPFSVAAASSASEILSDDIVDVPAVGVTNATTTYTVGNISPDDVTVSAVDETIVQSASVTTAGTVTYTVNPNYDYKNIVGTITLNSPSKGVNKVVYVNQLGSNLKVNDGTTNITVTLPKDQTSATFTINSKEFNWEADVNQASEKNLTATPTSGSASESNQTITISSTTAATAEEQTLGTIVIYRNGNTSDSQKRTITVKKASTETVLYQTGFEPGEGFTAGTTYNNASPNEQGPDGKKWSTVFGTVSTNNKISGSNSLAMRLYYNKDTKGYSEMKFDVTGVPTKVTFKAKASESGGGKILLTIEYSTDSGTNWTTVTGFNAKQLTSSAEDYEFDVTGSPAKYRIRFRIADTSTKPSSGNIQLTIDDVKFVQ